MLFSSKLRIDRSSLATASPARGRRWREAPDRGPSLQQVAVLARPGFPIALAASWRWGQRALPELRNRRMIPNFLRRQSAERAAMIDQRRPLVGVQEKNGADEQSMIAAVVIELSTRAAILPAQSRSSGVSRDRPRNARPPQATSCPRNRWATIALVLAPRYVDAEPTRRNDHRRACARVWRSRRRRAAEPTNPT